MGLDPDQNSIGLDPDPIGLDPEQDSIGWILIRIQ
jgi:hypothetical protein